MQEQDELSNLRSLQISDLYDRFNYASGSIIGRNHVLANKNNQDAFRVVRRSQFMAAVVCDGCGSGNHSEVGAKLGARMVIETIADLLNQDLAIGNQDFWNIVQTNLLQKLKGFVAIAQGDLEFAMEFVNDYLLFTIVGVLITPSETVTFSMGDGTIAMNGKLNQIPTYPDNAPPYLAYGLYRPEFVSFAIRDCLPTLELESILIATDGIDDLVKVENINQFWEEDRYFKNPDAIRRKLAMLNREDVKPDWNQRELIKQSGVLSDDTTLVAIRKKR
ncbi:MAG: protein phosphatase [Pseudanabaena frigida]|uniref:Protein phosphatase n=1 Tax=Pseudanabaena frigida TaxID=945775 RepID=A0A2W4YEF6_9CYAN|nr:MAG: protein phosphatase [Pseudanabaena frigida]